MLDAFESWNLMCSLSDRVLRANSATEQLERWCTENAIGDGHIVALPVPHRSSKLPDEESVALLDPYAPRQKTQFRRVNLATAGIVVVDALNWYFPDNLTVDIRRRLETTTVSFGHAIRPLQPRRRTFFIRRSTPWELLRRSADPASTVFEHRAVVYRADDVPLAIVHERFRKVLLCPSPPQYQPVHNRNVEDYGTAQRLANS
jgi:hypothetical protein